MINDVSTDLEDPPLIVLANAPIAFPDGARAALSRSGKPSPWIAAAAPARVQEAVLAAIASRSDWSLGDNGPGHITFLATSKIFQFKDDVTIRLREQGQYTRVDVRSRSRTGRSDLGANAKRIRALINASAAQLSLIQTSKP